MPSLYNEGMGTVSESYNYDRVKDREASAVEKPKGPETAGKAAAAASKKSRA